MKIKKNTSLKAFTLIELIVVITIMIILTSMAYIPFSHYKLKQEVRNSAKIVSQTLIQARNSAIYWLSNSGWNLDIWVLFKNWKWTIWLYWFPIKDNIWDYLNPDNKYFLKNIALEKNITISSSWGLILYKAITWSWILKWNFNRDWDKVILKVGLKNSNSWIMSNKIIYYPKTYISDIRK